MKLTQDQFLARVAKMSQILDDLGNTFFNFSIPKEIHVYQRINLIPCRVLDTLIDLDDYLTALDAFDAYWQTCSNLLERLCESILPIVFRPCNVVIKKTPSVIIFSCKSIQEPFSLQKITLQVLELAKFIKNHMFTEDKRPCDFFIEKWSQIITNSILSLNTNLCPLSSDSNQLFLKEFEVELKEIGLLSATMFPLLNLEKCESQLIKSHKLEILAAANNVLKSIDMNTSCISDGIIRGGLSSLLGKKYSSDDTSKLGQEGIDRDFCAPEYHVSNQTLSLLDFVYGTLDQIGSSTLSNNSELLYTARDLLDLHRAFCYYSDLPKLVTYNDSRCIAFHLNILGHQYSDTIRTYVGDIPSFLDMVSFTYSTGETLLGKELVHAVK
jgi:hypothetical protein